MVFWYYELFNFIKFLCIKWNNAEIKICEGWNIICDDDDGH